MLCHIAAALDNGAIDMKNVNQRPQVNVKLFSLIDVFLIYTKIQSSRKDNSVRTLFIFRWLNSFV